MYSFIQIGNVKVCISRVCGTRRLSLSLSLYTSLYVILRYENVNKASLTVHKYRHHNNNVRTKGPLKIGTSPAKKFDLFSFFSFPF